MSIEVRYVIHVNANCSDVNRSKPFYESVADLFGRFNTYPEPQDGKVFGIEGDLQWNAWIMANRQGIEGVPAVDLLEWKMPRPLGSPYSEISHLGMVRLCFTVPDIDAHYARLTKEGVHCLSIPMSYPLGPGEGTRLFCITDPDGIRLQFSQGAAAQFQYVNVNCSDLQRSAEFYAEILGFEIESRSQPGPVPGTGFGIDGEVDWDSYFLKLPGQPPGSFRVNLVEWKRPRPVGTPYREPNHLGLFRMALAVDDIGKAYDELRRKGVECLSPPITLNMDRGDPPRTAYFMLFLDPDGTCLEFIEIRPPSAS